MRELDDLCPSRRALRGALAGAVLLPGVLVACSSSDDADSADGGAPARLPASEVPVGRAKVVSTGGEPVVVAQPAAGQFVAFSAACTHQGSTVTAGDGLTLTCPSHGSRFDAADGSVLRGPASSPLSPVGVRHEGDELVLG